MSHMLPWTLLNILVWCVGVKALHDLRTQFDWQARTWFFLDWVGRRRAAGSSLGVGRTPQTHIVGGPTKASYLNAKRARPQATRLAVLTVLLAGPVALAAGQAGEAPSGQNPVHAFLKPSASALNHSSWDQLLQRYTKAGLVDYARLKAEPAALNAYVDALAAVREADYGAWSRDEKLAFWINAYNALTVKAIIGRYPIQPSWIASLRYPKNSIRQIPGVWDKLRFRAAGREVTLDQIEHEIIRKEFKEPRAHMALVCASLGCPPLRGEAFTAAKLSSQLDDQARLFLSDSRKFRLDKAGRRISGIPGPGIVHLSPIFRWFADDFKTSYEPAKGFGSHGAAQRAALNFISRYVADPDRRFLEKGDYTIEYLDYDWSLNERASR